MFKKIIIFFIIFSFFSSIAKAVNFKDAREKEIKNIFSLVKVLQKENLDSKKRKETVFKLLELITTLNKIEKYKDLKKLLLKQESELSKSEKKEIQTNLADLGYYPLTEIDGIFGPKTRKALKKVWFSNDFISLGIDSDIENCIDISNDKILMKLNKKDINLGDYIPDNLIWTPDRIRKMEWKKSQIISGILPFVEKLIDDAKKDGYELKINSVYRSYENQKKIYDDHKKRGELGVVVEPGKSEHQLGVAIDISYKDLSQVELREKSFIWLEKNAYKYGFMLSYPKDKVKRTGINYEPWHWRFVGLDIAKRVHSKKFLLEDLGLNIVKHPILGEKYLIFNTEKEDDIKRDIEMKCIDGLSLDKIFFEINNTSY